MLDGNGGGIYPDPVGTSPPSRFTRHDMWWGKPTQGDGGVNPPLRCGVGASATGPYIFWPGHSALRRIFSLPRGPHSLVSLSAVGVRRMKEFAGQKGRPRSGWRTFSRNDPGDGRKGGSAPVERRSALQFELRPCRAALHLLFARRPTLPRIVIGGRGQEDEGICGPKGSTTVWMADFQPQRPRRRAERGVSPGRAALGPTIWVAAMPRGVAPSLCPAAHTPPHRYRRSGSGG